ncbi:MAG: hypothetical protein FJ144_28340 [Deltaproteobacteria bacterium]|nr:hypothetical protein [Deltaproteobacteria bacterium]
MASGALDELARRFRDTSLPKEEWTHAAHLRVGAWHVDRHGAEEALRILRDGIPRLNDSHGTPNTETSGYHETITVAYVRLIASYLEAVREPASLEDRVECLLAGPLGERAVLLSYWSQETLMSPRARLEWVPPDRAPLALPAGGTASGGRRTSPPRDV